MRPFPILFLLFLTVPLVEIYLLIEVGRRIGPLPTIFLLVFTAVLGALLVRMQGMQTFIQIQQAMGQGRMPATEMIEGIMIMFAGALLLTPGFFTDAVGFLFLVPGVRRGLIGALISRQIQDSTTHDVSSVFKERPGRESGTGSGGRVIEGELDDD